MARRPAQRSTAAQHVASLLLSLGGLHAPCSRRRGRHISSCSCCCGCGDAGVPGGLHQAPGHAPTRQRPGMAAAHLTGCRPSRDTSSFLPECMPLLPASARPLPPRRHPCATMFTGGCLPRAQCLYFVQRGRVRSCAAGDRQAGPRAIWPGHVLGLLRNAQIAVQSCESVEWTPRGHAVVCGRTPVQLHQRTRQTVMWMHARMHAPCT